ncbi:MAG: methyl-accepting chemotaxis protein, partial [Nitrospira sp.]|nr:methyl-accepting chemotaxis protein [Nitrospira sp.]
MSGLSKRLKIKHKILLSFSIIAILLIATAIFSFIDSKYIVKESAFLKNNAFTNLQNAKSLMEDAKVIGDQFSNTGAGSDTVRLTKTDELNRHFLSVLTKLRQNENHDPELLNRIDSIERLFNDFYKRGYLISETLINNKDNPAAAYEMREFSNISLRLNQELDAHLRREEEVFNMTIEGIGDTAKRNGMFVNIMTVVTVLVSLLMAFVISNVIIKPLQQLSGVFKDIASGEGDLRRRLNSERDDEIGEVSEGFNKFVDKLSSILTKVAELTQKVGFSAMQLSATADHISKGTQSQNMQVVHVASAIEEMSATVAEVAKNAGKAAEFSKQASGLAVKGGNIVSETVG